MVAKFKEECENCNAEPTIGNVFSILAGTPTNQLLIRRSDDQRGLTITFDTKEYTIKFQSLYLPHGADDLRIELIEGDNAPSFIENKTGQTVILGQVVESLIEALLL